jgi:hypothetical protein
MESLGLVLRIELSMVAEERGMRGWGNGVMGRKGARGAKRGRGNQARRADCQGHSLLRC